MRDRLRVGVAQIHSLLGDVRRNLEKHLEYVERARELGVEVLAFPELSLTGYLLRDLAYEVSDAAREALGEIAEASRGLCVLVGLVHEPRAGIYENSVAVVRDGSVAGVVSKLYLPDYGLFEESRYFREGSCSREGVFECGGWRVAPIICEDAWHPEPAELAARRGADVVFIHASSPIRGLYGSGEANIERVWEAIAVTRAVENACYVVFANRVGPEDEEYFWGGSMVVAPDGEVVARAKKMEEELLVADLDLYRLRASRRFSSFKRHRRDIHVVLGELD
ncbi:nitrilase-related carbon-nitrogen hydrolase [Thermofilum pendens]|uniref:Nitrilase/cyanide hydratase and apolipoprotein N-acyltransferase n=1 Tax=Thermofilum pendens (strain DSM 2475 / Hrk 5) TaxID=368408 RepID=A1S062_THEPD|nr:nitrilase-related carbon-nitrogen hydrolase [Thermofilum pendens]ABL78842.1 Nitrilase/cyanide hydratase and apolipoprotein N-acyltransferase [Thermofilum pendens Hrk 5]